METLEAPKKEILIEEYNLADGKGKSMLEKLFGKSAFIPNIRDRVNGIFENALPFYDKMDDDVLRLINYTGTNPDMISSSNYHKAIILTAVFNEGWVADFTNDDQPKYQVYYRHKPGFGLAYGAYVGWATHTVCGGRLCFRDKETAIYVTTTFPEIFRDFLTIK